MTNFILNKSFKIPSVRVLGFRVELANREIFMEIFRSLESKDPPLDFLFFEPILKKTPRLIVSVFLIYMKKEYFKKRWVFNNCKGNIFFLKKMFFSL